MQGGRFWCNWLILAYFDHIALTAAASALDQFSCFKYVYHSELGLLFNLGFRFELKLLFMKLKIQIYRNTSLVAAIGI